MNIWNNKITPSIIIFIIVLILRIGFIKTYNVDYISNDGVTYHNIAVNIVLGRGYSNFPNPPYEPYFFRELVYPLFISSVYFIYHKLGGDLTYISSYSENSIYPNHKEFIYLKIIQAIIDSISCVLMYLIFSLIIKK